MTCRTYIALIVSTEIQETLWGLPDTVKSRIAAEACRRRALTPSTLRLFVEHCPTEVCLPDCTQLEPDVLSVGLLEACTPKLERLELGLCGRGFTDSVAREAAARGGFSGLKSLRLSGAYRLGDDSILALLSRVPGLQTLALPHCSRVEGSFLESLPRLLPQLRTLDVSGCRGVSASALCDALQGLPALDSLALDGIAEVNDDLLRILSLAAPNLKELSLRTCPNVTAAGLAALKLPLLRRLALDECRIQDGIKALTQGCPDLEEVSLHRCQGVNDEVVRALAQRGNLRCASFNGAAALTDAAVEELLLRCGPVLEELDLSWCRGIGAAALGKLTDGCPRLRRLILWGCTQADDIFLNGHSNDVVEIVGRGEVLLPVAV